MGLSVKSLRHGLSLDVVAEDFLRRDLGVLGLSRPLHPSAGESLSLEGGGSSVKNKDGADFIKEELAHSVIETQ